MRSTTRFPNTTTIAERTRELEAHAHLEEMAEPDPKTLVCASEFSWNGRMWPEFDRFGLFTHEEALGRVGKSLAGLLAGIFADAQCGASR